MPVIMIDIFQSAEFEAALSKYLTCVRTNMVPLGLADVFWQAGHRITLEHKKVGSFLSEAGQRLDNQLRKHTQHADEVGLIIEGMITPHPHGGSQIWEEAVSSKVFYKKHRDAVGYEAIMAYVWSLHENWGINTYFFPNLEALALGVAAFVSNSLKPDHQTLQRYGRSKPVLWEPDPYVESLIGIGDARIGERTAKKLLERWKNPFEVFMAPGFEVEEVIGREATKRLFKGIGREY